MKINVIKTPAVCKFMTTAMLVTATLGGAKTIAAPKPMPTQTELMSPAVSQAVQAYSAQTGTYSSQRNTKLDEKYIALGKASPYPFDVEKEKSEIADLYKDLGTFGATFVLQNEVNLKSLDKMVNNMILGAEYWSTGNKVFNLTTNLKDWYLKQYEPYVYGKASNLTSKKASAEEYSKLIDGIARESFSDANFEYYNNSVKEFKAKQTGSNIQKAADLVAYKSYLLSYMCVYTTMKQLGIDQAWGMGDLDKVFAKEAKPSPVNK